MNSESFQGGEHVEAYLDAQTDAAGEHSAIEDAIYEKMERLASSSLQERVNEIEQRARRLDSPRMEAELNEHRALPDDGAEVPDETLDDKLDRVFGSDDSPKVEPKQPAAQPEAQQTQPVENGPAWLKADPSPESAEILSFADSQTIARYEIELQQLNDDIARWNEAAQLIQHITDPYERNEALSRLQAEQLALQQRGETLNRAGEQIVGTVQERMKGRFEQYVAREREKFAKALPGTDTAKLRSYLLGLGFNERDVSTAHDHRILVAFEKARRYDEQQRQAKQTNVVRRAVRKPTNARQQLQRAQRSGNYDGIDGALERRLDEIFR